MFTITITSSISTTFLSFLILLGFKANEDKSEASSWIKKAFVANCGGTMVVLFTCSMCAVAYSRNYPVLLDTFMLLRDAADAFIFPFEIFFIEYIGMFSTRPEFVSAKQKARKALIVSGVALCALLAANMFKIFVFKKQRLPGNWLYIIEFLITLFLMVCVASIVYAARRELGRLRCLCFIGIFFLQLVSIIVLWFYEESLFFSINVALLIYMYISMQNDNLISEMKLKTKYQKNAYVDALTGVYNRNAFIETENQYGTYDVPKDLKVIVVDINNLKVVNDTQGHDKGDEIIIETAKCISDAVAGYGRVFRNGGDEFFAVVSASREEFESILSKMVDCCDNCSLENARRFSFSIGTASAEDYDEIPFSKLVKVADRAMYEEKSKFYELHKELDRRTDQG